MQRWIATNAFVYMVDTAEKVQEKLDLESDLSAVHIRITEYDTLDELIADLSGSPTLRKASHNGWVDVGEDKCVLHVPNQGYLMLTREKSLWTGSFRFDTKDFRAKSFEIPLTATDVTSRFELEIPGCKPSLVAGMDFLIKCQGMHHIVKMLLLMHN